MSKSKLLIYLSVLFVLTIAILLCRPDKKVDLTSLDPNFYDQSWAIGSPCNAPCWYGLTPGKSSRETALEVAKSLSFIDLSKSEVHAQIASFPCKNNKHGHRGYVKMSFSSGFLDTLWLTPNYPITFEQAIDFLGDPDGFSVYPTDPGITHCYLGVVWNKKQLILEHTSDISFWGRDLCQQITQSGGIIPKKLLVESVVISLPGYLENMKNFKPWRGFSDK